jgi:putative endonuclease
VWRAGEGAALEAYRRRGFRVLARNWRSPLGELDLVLERDGLVVFCEVKARRGAGVAGPHESVGHAKRRKIRMLAEAFLATGRAASDARCRFDVASVLLGPGRVPDVYLFEDAF